MKKEKNTLNIGEAAKFLGVSIQTLRRWDKSGKLKAKYSEGGHRYYLSNDLEFFLLDLSKLGWAWASSAQPPQIQDEYYCERNDRFTSRLEKMAMILLQTNGLSEETTSLLTAVAGEIGDNSFAHNVGRWPDVPGIFFAYNINKRVIVLADRGQGIFATLHRIRPELKTDAEALRVAFTEILSGRDPERRGNGLKVVRRIIESEGLSLQLRSGLGVVIIPNSGPMEIGTAKENVRGVYAVINF